MTRKTVFDPSAPVFAAAHALARRYLQDAKAASRRLQRRRDAEAVHDFRVALRRLRSVFRAFLRHPLPRKLRQRTRAVARATNETRDAEVTLNLLSGLTGMSPEAQAAARLCDRLRGRRERTHRRDVVAEFTRLERDLDRSLRGLGDKNGGRSYLTVMRRRAAEGWEELERALDAVSGPDRDAIHAARIAGKRLRYLIEPLVGHERAAQAAIEELKGLQDALGEYGDTWLVADEIRRAAEQAGTEQARATIDRALHGQPAGVETDAVAWLVPLADWARRRLEAQYLDIKQRFQHNRERLAPVRALIEGNRIDKRGAKRRVRYNPVSSEQEDRDARSP